VIGQGIVETDTLIGNDLQTDADTKAASETTVTGETIPLMIWHEDVTRTLLTPGAVAEERIAESNVQIDRTALNQAW
jgi:hypothetical protein